MVQIPPAPPFMIIKALIFQCFFVFSEEYIDNHNTIDYMYNIDGIRTSKTVNNVKTKYYLNNSMIVLETKDNDVIYYIYNEVDGLIGFKYNEDSFYYIKNLLNDIIGILDSNYIAVAKYTYDSWANILSITDGEGIDVSNIPNHIANINPFRYRSYYYDVETKMYYLNNRYYHPEISRFINADEILIQSSDSLLGNNLYAYAYNNPVTYIDPSGQGILNALSKIVKAAVKVVKKVVKTITKVVNDTKPKSTPTASAKSSFYTYVNAGGVGYTFLGNNYFNEVSTYEIAKDVWNEYKRVNGYTMPGRTINGLVAELDHHYLMYSNNFGKIDPLSKAIYERGIECNMEVANGKGNLAWADKVYEDYPWLFDKPKKNLK